MRVEGFDLDRIGRVPALRTTILARTGTYREILPGLRCAGDEYAAIAFGVQNFAVYWRTLPWDHAPGTLFLAEAGGKAARFDGCPYRRVEDGVGLLAAQTPELRSELHSKLFGEIDGQA
jgi:fructose-1,6-bisphosphatase/inositol monophosphatase family enzyme